MSDDRGTRDRGAAEVNQGGSTLGRMVREAGGALVFPLLAILLALVIGAVIVLATGNNPATAFESLVVGAIGSPLAIGRTVLNATPLIFTGLAVAVAFRAGLFNIGGEGQVFIGAITAAGLGAALGFLGPLGTLLILLACILTGFLWGAIPGFLKAYFGAHEVITTIMLNFIAIDLATYLALHPLSGGGLVPGTATIDPAARIPTLSLSLGRANYGFFLALLAALAVYLLLWRTKRGFELRAVGLSPGAANYAGMRIGLNTVLALAIGGALLGRNHPVGVVLGALLFGGLASGAEEMQFSTNVPLDLTDVLLAVILLLVTATRLVELIVGKRARVLASGTHLEKGLGQ